MLKELKRKFIFTNMLLVGVVLVIILVVFGKNTYDVQMNEINRTLQSPFENSNSIINNSILENDDTAVTEDPIFGSDKELKNGRFGFLTSMVVVVDNNTKAVTEAYSRGASLSGNDLVKAVNKVFEGKNSQGKIGNQDLFYRKTPIGSNNQSVIVFVASSRFDHAMKSMFITSAVVLSVGLLLVYIISRFIAGIAIKPVKKSWEQQQRFIADASHELKTPLTVILANNEILKTKTDATISEEKQWIDSTLAEAKHMKKLVEDMLFLAKNDGLDMKLQKEKVNFSELLEADILQFEPIAYENKVEIESLIDEDVEILGDRTQLRQLAHILLDNSIKYSGDIDAKVQVILKGGSHPELIVCNTGDIIEKEQQSHLFDRFYRSDKARTIESMGGSYGLGLSIAKAIVEKNGGKITVKSDETAGPNNQKGTAFTIRL